MENKSININTLVKEYLKLSKSINQSNEALLTCKRGLINKKLKSKLLTAKDEYLQYSHILEEYDGVFVGDLEFYMHGDLALLAIKDANYQTISRARSVCFNSLERFEKTLAAIEDSLNFRISIYLAWLSIGVAVVSTVTNLIGH